VGVVVSRLQPIFFFFWGYNKGGGGIFGDLMRFLENFGARRGSEALKLVINQGMFCSVGDLL